MKNTKTDFCYACETDTQQTETLRNLSLVIKGVRHEIEMPGWVCDACNHFATPSEIFDAVVADCCGQNKHTTRLD